MRTLFHVLGQSRLTQNEPETSEVSLYLEKTDPTSSCQLNVCDRLTQGRNVKKLSTVELTNNTAFFGMGDPGPDWVPIPDPPPKKHRTN